MLLDILFYYIMIFSFVKGKSYLAFDELFQKICAKFHRGVQSGGFAKNIIVVEDSADLLVNVEANKYSVDCL